jgi:hypothetical protein
MSEAQGEQLTRAQHEQLQAELTRVGSTERAQERRRRP